MNILANFFNITSACVRNTAKTCECLKYTFNLDTVEWDEASGKAGQDLALARPGRLKRRETVKGYPADKK